MGDVGISHVSLGAIASVSTPLSGVDVDAVTVGAGTGRCCPFHCRPCGLRCHLARPVTPDSPVKHQRDSSIPNPVEEALISHAVEVSSAEVVVPESNQYSVKLSKLCHKI